jgi:hypothetical protein
MTDPRDSHNRGPAGAGNGQDGILGILQRITDGPERGRELRKVFSEAKQLGYSMGDLTVLSPQNDPYRFDTESGHQNGKWFAEVIARLVPSGTVHLRGLHYRLAAAGDVIRVDKGKALHQHR